MTYYVVKTGVLYYNNVMKKWIALLFFISSVAMGDTVSIYFENDCFVSTDKYYTNGVKLEYSISNHGFVLGQNMYTPSDIENPSPTDRPYGGYLYGGYYWTDGDNYLEVDIGVVGPMSGAEATQKFIHKLIGSQYPVGWENQIKNEPTLQGYYKRYFQYSILKKGWIESDIVPSIGAALGNVFINNSAGMNLRIGHNLPPVTKQPIIPSVVKEDDYSLYITMGTDNRVVYRNIFLDGNTWRDSSHVTKKPFVSDLIAGIGASYKGVAVEYNYVYRTKEFVGQDSPAKYGSIQVNFKF